MQSTFFTLLSCLIFSTTLQAAVGFSKGERFSVISLKGQLSVKCNYTGYEGSAYYTCESQVLEPATYDYFIGPAISEANRVVLNAERADKSIREKEEAYIGAKGQSARAINLWASSVFERPLLNYGANKVTYKLMKDNVVLEEGTFKVQIDGGSARSCPNHAINSTFPGDCESSFSICERYFRSFNYCH